MDVNKNITTFIPKYEKKQRSALVTDFPFVIFCRSIKIKMLVNKQENNNKNDNRR